MSRDVYIRGYSPSRGLSKRAKMLRKIHAEFPKLRPDLRHSTEELREARLEYCTQVLNLRKPLTSMKRLTEGQLGRILDRMKADMGYARVQPGLPGCNVRQFQPRTNTDAAITATRSTVSCGKDQMGKEANGSAEVLHLASAESVWAINRVFDYLKWTTKGREGFLQSKFERTSPRLLSPGMANSCLMILLNIAASKDLKEQRGYKTVSRQAAGRYIHELKARLGIDQSH